MQKLLQGNFFGPRPGRYPRKIHRFGETIPVGNDGGQIVPERLSPVTEGRPDQVKKKFVIGAGTADRSQPKHVRNDFGTRCESPRRNIEAA